MQVRIHLLDLQYIEQHSLAKVVEQLLADLHLAMAGTACEQGPQVDRFQDQPIPGQRPIGCMYLFAPKLLSAQ